MEVNSRMCLERISDLEEEMEKIKKTEMIKDYKKIVCENEEEIEHLRERIGQNKQQKREEIAELRSKMETNRESIEAITGKLLKLEDQYKITHRNQKKSISDKESMDKAKDVWSILAELKPRDKLTILEIIRSEIVVGKVKKEMEDE